MFRNKLAVGAATLMLGAFSFDTLAPTADAVTAIGNSSTITTSDPNIQLAYVKKKIVVKKKGYKKTTIVYSRPKHRYGAVRTYGLTSYKKHYYGCRTVVTYVKDRHHGKSVKVVRRVC